MVLAIIFIVIAALLVIYGFVNIWLSNKVDNENLIMLTPVSWVLAINFGVAGGTGLGNLNIFSGHFGDLQQELLTLANLGSSFLYGFGLTAALLGIIAFCTILSSLGG